MTTEQMDWLDDERAGRHSYVGVTPENLVDKVKPDPMGDAPLSYRLRAMGAVRSKRTDGEIVEWVNAPLSVVVIEAYRAAEAVTDAEKLKATIDAKQGEPSMTAAAGWCMPSSHVYNFLPTDEEIKMAKRERRKAKKARRRAEKTVTVSAEDYVTMAEEPIENRLRRAWLNGFKDGVDRASYAATESTGRWDY